jgi:hypothetical protein
VGGGVVSGNGRIRTAAGYSSVNDNHRPYRHLSGSPGLAGEVQGLLHE